MIIAEIGANHQGDMDLARCLIQYAKQSGADAVKLQLYSTNGLQRTPETLAVLKKSELDFKQAQRLFSFGETIGIEVFWSVFDKERVKWSEEIGVKRYKIASRLDDKEVIDAIKETKKPVIASIAPNYPREKGWLSEFYDVDILYCLSKYPAPNESLRFKYIDFTFDFQGFSDHTIGLDAARVAIARGAKIIEKHFALDHQTGIDARWSMTPDELKELRKWYDVVQEVL